MTKYELLRFLEPFSDDIKIVVSDERLRYVDVSPTYELRKHPFRIHPTGTLLESGEGIVRLDVLG